MGTMLNFMILSTLAIAAYIVGGLIGLAVSNKINEYDTKIILDVRELSKKNIDKETIRSLIEEKYDIILSNDWSAHMVETDE